MTNSAINTGSVGDDAGAYRGRGQGDQAREGGAVGSGDRGAFLIDEIGVLQEQGCKGVVAGPRSCDRRNLVVLPLQSRHGLDTRSELLRMCASTNVSRGKETWLGMDTLSGVRLLADGA